MSSGSEDERLNSPRPKRSRPTLVRVDNAEFLEQLVADGLASDVPSSSGPDHFLSSDSEEDLEDFNGSEIGDPDYVPSDVETCSVLSSSDTEADENSLGNSAFDSENMECQSSGFSGGSGSHVGSQGASGTEDPGGSGDLGDNVGVQRVRPAVQGSVRVPNQRNRRVIPTNATLDCVWSDEDTPFVFPESAYFADYKENTQVTVEMTDPSPLAVYCHFIDEELWTYIAQETNRYAFQHISSTTLLDKSRVKSWQPTDVSEMKTFVGIIICMGLVQCPQVNLYWSKNSLYGNQLIKSAMTRDRFLLLKKFWHFSNDSETHDVSDRLYKVRC